MSRTIKFRAWDKEYGHMYQNAYPFEHLVYVEMFDDDETFEQFKHKMQVINRKYFYFIIAKDIELMQFTGLKDRQGKDIYEGDLVATGFTPGHVRGIVRIGEWTTSVETREYSIEKPYYGVYLEGLLGLDDELLNGELYVVGNIYETPK